MMQKEGARAMRLETTQHCTDGCIGREEEEGRGNDAGWMRPFSIVTVGAGCRERGGGRGGGAGGEAACEQGNGSRLNILVTNKRHSDDKHVKE